MKILVACELPETPLVELRELGLEVVYEPAVQGAALVDRLQDVAVLIVGATRVSPEAIAAGNALQVIVCAGAAASNIALDEASAAGVFVMHCPDKDAAAVAELAFGLIIALDRRIVDCAQALRSGDWRPPDLVEGHGLASRTLGILGCGQAGCEIASRAQAFGMHVVGWAPGLTPEQAAAHGVEFCNRPREVARRSDVVVVVAPTCDEPDRLVDAEFLEGLRSGAILINVGHPSAVDEAALARAIERQNLRVAVDTFSSEPAGGTGRFRNRLFELPGVIGTPHIGSQTVQARQTIAAEVVRIVRAFLVSGEVSNCVNLITRSPATWQLILRVRDQVGVMAAILEAVRSDGINAEEISSRVFRGAKAAWCTIALDERPSREALDAIRALDDVLHLDLRAMV